MTEIFTAIGQLGFPIGTAIYLLWEYAGKITAIQLELVKTNEKITNMSTQMTSFETNITTKIDKIWDKLNERIK